ncbi:hypothetical protein T12_6961 [Trichinella patagoniensis]|uniref:Uncharacterized protein n=1 Tax=Trichinella patagoniensis TaxID=990121 RepID=A0A0V0ZMF5_9BILA|nr:hypothetical protein T12_6961 [Trichinella patagoniensis]
MVIWSSGPDGCFSRGSLAPQPGAARRQESDLAGGARVLFLLYPQTLGTSPWAGNTDEVGVVTFLNQALVFSFEMVFVGICNRKTWRNTNTLIKAGTAQPKIELSEKSTPAMNIGPPSRIGRTETIGFLSRLVDHINSYMKELERAREELTSSTLLPNLLELLNPYWDKACQLAEKYEDSLPIGKPADDIIEWHNFAIEVAKARSIVEDYLKKKKIGDDRRDMKQNSEALKLRDTTKFTYLRYCLTGNALNAIDGLAVRSANYSAAIEILKSRFGRRDLIIQTHIRKLLDGTPCNDASLKSSRKFYDEVVLQIRSLEALGTNPSSPVLTASEVLLEIFKLKVHLSTRKRWEALILSEPSKLGSFLVIFTRWNKGGGVGQIDETLPLKSSTEKDEGVLSNQTLLGRTSSEKENLLQTARAILQYDDGNKLFVTCLFDSGCQGSLIKLGESHTVVQHHSKRNKDKWPKAAEEVLKNVHVDDLLFSLDDRTETMECVKELKQD